jgi:putative transposase
MARPLRIACPGALYHVTSRGNARAAIYSDDADRRGFLDVLTDVVQHGNWLCHAFCLMDNHYHLVLETPDGHLAREMRQLNGIYTQQFNRRHNRIGHVFQGRYKAILVERDSYLLTLCRYVVLNPVRGGLVKAVADYHWSSSRSTVGLESCAACLQTDWLLAQFGNKRTEAQRRYGAFIQDGIDQASPWCDLKGQIFLAHEGFVTRMQAHVAGLRTVKEVPRQQRYADRPALQEIFASRSAMSRAERAHTIYEAYRC